MDDKVISSIAAKNAEGYHKPYGDDEVTAEAKMHVREMFKIHQNSPVVFTASKEQAITGVMQFLKTTRDSTVLVSPGSYDEHRRYGRDIKLLELSGDHAETDKLDSKGVNALLQFHNSNDGKHVPAISSVMIQQPTTKGYVYTPEEIKELALVCHKNHVPLVMQMKGFNYYLAAENKNHSEYTSDCGVDAVTLGFGGLGGGLSSAIVVLDRPYIPYHGIASAEDTLQIMLDRTVKENGGKQSDSSTLNSGWREMMEFKMMESELWRENAKKANRCLERIKTIFNKYEFEGKPPIFENSQPANNVLVAKLPAEFLEKLNSKGYNFAIDDDVKLRISYSIRDEEIDKLEKNCDEAYKEYNDKTIPKTNPRSPKITPVVGKTITRI
jgi:threonine aldolase